MTARVDILFTLRPFRRPQLWLVLWLLMLLAVILLSLVPAPPIPKVLTSGKFDHFIAYFVLSACVVQLCADRGLQCITGFYLIGLGIGLELAQGLMTDYRDMSIYDAFVDGAGVALGFATTWTPLAGLLLRIDKLLPRLR